MNYLITQLQGQVKDALVNVINNNYNVNLTPEEINVDIPKNLKFGILSTNIALILANKFSKNPNELAVEIKAGLSKYIASLPTVIDTTGGIQSSSETVKNKALKELTVSVVGGFLNFNVSEDLKLKELQEILQKKDSFGNIDLLKNKTIELEHTSPNPNKALHLGHLRNNVTSMAVGHMLEKAGANVIYEAVDNNRGIAISVLMWGYLKFGRKDRKILDTYNLDKVLTDWYANYDKWLTPQDLKKKPDWFAMDFYVQASKARKENPQDEEAIRELTRLWEQEAESYMKKHGKAVSLQVWSEKVHPVLEIWRVVLNWAHKGILETLNRLGSKWDHIWYEHEHYVLGKQWVEKGLQKGVFKESKGAIVTNLAKYNLPDTVVLKSDGTSLYITQDLALTALKVKKYHADRYIWVVGSEQSLALKQLFAVCEMLDIAPVEKLQHLAYGYVRIKGLGTMGSRTGNVILTDTLLNQAKDEVLNKLKTREDITDAQKEYIAENLAISSIKYSILKVSRNRDVEFDVKEALSLEGNTAPYIMYSYVRAKSVLRKAKANAINEIDIKDINLSTEVFEILNRLILFPNILTLAVKKSDPSIIAEYLYTTVKSLNSTYEKVKFIGTDNLAIIQAYVYWFESVAQTLGLPTVEYM